VSERDKGYDLPSPAPRDDYGNGGGLVVDDKGVVGERDVGWGWWGWTLWSMISIS
jgi:hypothetical protein